MTHRTALTALAWAALLALATSAVAEDEKEREGGLTGTGIVGEVTALGSIIVNGQRITFAPDLPVRSALAPTQADALAPGAVVAVAVVPDGPDWAATAIRQVHAVIGPVARVGQAGFTVLGVEVTWDNSPLSVGDWVAVSGFWAPDAVVATKVDRIAPQATVSLQGSYGLGDGGATVGSLTLDLEPLQHAAEGDVIRVTGRLNGNRIEVTQVHHGLFEGPVSLVLAEGYFTDVAPSGHYTVAGSGLSAYTSDSMSGMATDRIRVCGRNGGLGLPEGDATDTLAKRLGCPAAAQ